MTRFGEISPIWQLERVYLVFCKIITYFGKFLGLISTGPLIKKNFTIAGSNEFTVSKERERERERKSYQSQQLLLKIATSWWSL